MAAVIIAAALFAGAGLVIAQAASTTHVVVQDETLHQISEQYFGNAFSWPLIWEANKEKIEDPHWIYPGQELVIPPLTAAGPVGLPDTAAPAEPAPAEAAPVAAAPEPEPEPEPEPSREQPKVRVRQIGLVSRLMPAVSEEMAMRGGYISPADEKPLGRIVSHRADLIDKDHLYTNEKVYINLGSRDGVKVGDKYAIFRQSARIKHPVTKQDLGRIVTIPGVIVVDEVEERTAGAKIVKCHEPLGKREAIKPYLDVIVPKGLSPLPASKTAEGRIVAFSAVREANTFNDILYIDLGTADGIMPGDVFEIYRPQDKARDPDRGQLSELPVIVLGHLQVLAVRNSTATAYVNRAHREGIAEGERIRLIKQLPR